MGRWFKRLYFGVNHSTLGDYFDRMRLHAALFPETAYRLEGFTINPRSKALAPVVLRDLDAEIPGYKSTVERKVVEMGIAKGGSIKQVILAGSIKSGPVVARLKEGTVVFRAVG